MMNATRATLLAFLAALVAGLSIALIASSASAPIWAWLLLTALAAAAGIASLHWLHTTRKTLADLQASHNRVE
jgi:hypothetical protein